MEQSKQLRVVVLLVWLASVATIHAQGKNTAALNQVLQQMEAVGKTFRSFSAHFVQKKYTKVLEEFGESENGEFYYARNTDGSALLRQEFISPSRKVLTVKGGTATLYQPSLKEAQIYGLGKNKDKAEYLALGIGQSPSKLQQTWDIQYSGTEAVNNVPCSVLVLKPKNPSMAAWASSVTLWVNKANGVPIQDKMQEPNGDYTLITFSNEKLNSKIQPSLFDQKLPQGTQIQKY